MPLHGGEMRQFARDLDVAAAHEAAVDVLARHDGFEFVERAQQASKNARCPRHQNVQQLFGAGLNAR